MRRRGSAASRNFYCPNTNCSAACRCRLVEDTAWHPVMKEEVEEWGSGAKGSIFKFFLGTPLKLWASVGHWALWHFDVNKFTDRQKPRVRRLSLW